MEAIGIDIKKGICTKIKCDIPKCTEWIYRYEIDKHNKLNHTYYECNVCYKIIKHTKYIEHMNSHVNTASNIISIASKNITDFNNNITIPLFDNELTNFNIDNSRSRWNRNSTTWTRFARNIIPLEQNLDVNNPFIEEQTYEPIPDVLEEFILSPVGSPRLSPVNSPRNNNEDENNIRLTPSVSEV